VAIVCQTRKGRGVSLLEGQFGFHGKPPSAEQAEQALSELEQVLDRQTKALDAAEPEPSDA
jgi:transketolase